MIIIVLNFPNYVARVLGIGGLDHNGSMCIVEGGIVKSFVELERVLRVKNLGFENTDHVETMLELMVDQPIDVIALADKHWWNKKRIWRGPLLKKLIPKAKLVVHNHHLCHHSTAFYLSPFEDAITIVIDGQGDGLSMSWSLGKRDQAMQIIGGQSSKYSLGRLWWAISEACGFPGHHSAGKTMAFASLGSSSGFLVDCVKWDGLKFKFVHADINDEGWRKVSQIKTWAAGLIANGKIQSLPDLAANLQELTIHIGTVLAMRLSQEYGKNSICLAGGIALNGLLNQAISELEGIEHVYIPPVTDDRGISLGAALQSAIQVGDIPEIQKRFSPYLGPIWEPNAYTESIDFSPVATGSDAESKIVQLLVDGGLVAWHQGRSEAGPRALCHRSLLATPTDKVLAERINLDIKHREWFRPFGCSVKFEDAEDWLLMKGDSPYMLRIVYVVTQMRKYVSGVVHIDGTTRPHLVQAELLPELWSILSRLKDFGHPPIVLNTSLNRRGEPLSETALDTFTIAKEMGLDGVYLNGELWMKNV
jgi:carbamoyltransferase